MKKTKVLIIDDSALIRKMFVDILSSDPDIEVVGTANDPLDAREKIKVLNPDVITLDIEMPKMDGISFLKKIMSLRPMPVVMISSLTQKGAAITLKALELGAVDYIPKSGSASFDIDTLSSQLIEKIKIAAKAKVKILKSNVDDNHDPRKPLPFSGCKKDKIIAIGSSTGGVEALRDVLTILPENTPPVVITQHMPKQFTRTFAERMNGLSHIHIQEAQNNSKLLSGNAYIAPGDRHMEIQRIGAEYKIHLHDGDFVSGHKPSVNVLFESVAEQVGANAIGVMLTGMGKDGAVGMLHMKLAGAYNIGQDEDTSIVYGMPKAAYLAGAIDEQVSLDKIAETILKRCI